MVQAPKFAPGQKVHYIKDPAHLLGEVKGVTLTEKGWQYAISSQDVDVVNRTLIEGVKHAMEDELELPEQVGQAVEATEAPEGNTISIDLDDTIGDGGDV